MRLAVHLDFGSLRASLRGADVVSDNIEIADCVEYPRERVEAAAEKMFAVLRSPQAGSGDALPSLLRLGVVPHFRRSLEICVRTLWRDSNGSCCGW